MLWLQSTRPAGRVAELRSFGTTMDWGVIVVLTFTAVLLLITIVSHDYDGLKKDAEVLDTFLGRPLWERGA